MLTNTDNNVIIILSKDNTPKGRKENKMKDMGMTDKQFNGFIRFLIDGLEEVKEESDAEKKDERLQKILDNLQSTLED